MLNFRLFPLFKKSIGSQAHVMDFSQAYGPFCHLGIYYTQFKIIMNPCFHNTTYYEGFWLNTINYNRKN